MKIRVISAIVALAIVIPVFLTGGMVYNFAVYVLSLLALKEYIGVKSVKKDMPNFIK